LDCLDYFFFSSRRRHTRFSRDWSSDVCSSDLGQQNRHEGALAGAGRDVQCAVMKLDEPLDDGKTEAVALVLAVEPAMCLEEGLEIGRASCRERVSIWGACAL